MHCMCVNPETSALTACCPILPTGVAFCSSTTTLIPYRQTPGLRLALHLHSIPFILTPFSSFQQFLTHDAYAPDCCSVVCWACHCFLENALRSSDGGAPRSADIESRRERVCPQLLLYPSLTMISHVHAIFGSSNCLFTFREDWRRSDQVLEQLVSICLPSRLFKSQSALLARSRKVS
jgi:hypothetical protein